MYDHEPSENDSSNRIQPTFFHTPATQLNNPPKKSSQDPAKNPYYQSPPPYSLHSPNQSEPSAPPLEPEVYPPGRSEAYPPVGPYSPVGPETYPPAGPYSPQGVYPPTNYNHPGYPNPPYSNYGAVPPYPNTSDASPSWPWMAPPANGEQPTEPSRKKKFGCLRLCKLFWYFVIGMVFFGAISELLSDSVSKPHCVDSINWESLPKQIEYSGSLRITVDGNLSSGRIIIKDSDQETPKGVIYLTGRVSARSVENVAYKLKQDAKETHLEFQISSLSLSCVNIDAVIYVPKGTRLIYIDLPHSTIQLPNGLMNADMLQLSSSYAPIVIDSDWRGRNLKLTTNNADIQIKSIQADGSVMLATKNSAITVTEKVEAGDTIDMVTTNAPIHLKYIKSNRTTLVTSNARIDIDHALIESYISAHTSNSRLSLHLRSQSNPEVLVKTSNGRALVSMPIIFEGSFMIKTSSFNSVSFSDNLNWSNIKFANRGYVMGERFDPSQGPSVVPGSLRIETSNANVGVYFADE
ncbi:hypothetical protein G6F60_010958 [Rhizopus arrhizus]|nr:hypothetical protein G6F60_010958 [Rhizopus arrhizus]